jgi:NTP pyrophosphatase (non-canonical NTP hydrolase)
MNDSLDSLTETIVRFRDERDWEQFHTPKNLAAALSVEVAELQETMLWKTDDEVDELLKDPSGRQRVAHEIADILIYAMLMAQATHIDPAEAIRSKLEENAIKYPVDKARGNAKKYTEHA